MIKTFAEANEEALHNEKASIRALQAWLYLIGKAGERQTVRYKHLRKIFGYSYNVPVSTNLEYIMWYCEYNVLPALTVIVVNSEGLPGKSLTTVSENDFNKEREKVFEYNWFNLIPPTINELRDSKIY